MTFEAFMVGFGWFAALMFVGVAGYRILFLARMPLNIRWEVYPVPHEPKARRQYGGSYMEDTGWAVTTRPSWSLAPYVEIAIEVATLKRVREHNEYGIWPLSLLMHWGLYLYFGWILWLAAGNLFNAGELVPLTVAVGLLAHVIGAGGALGLVIRRRTSAALRGYTSPLDYFNLLFIAAFFVAGLASWLGDHSFAAHKAYIGSLIYFRPVHVPASVSTAFILFGLFLIYMPFTKLIHYFAKYFTFDQALWDDSFKTKGSAADRQVIEQLGYRPAWAAPHIAAGRTWLEQAQTCGVAEEKK